jgi:elongation factor 1-beta
MFALHVILRAQIKMAQVVVTLKIMPVSPDSDFSRIEQESRGKIATYSGSDDMKVELEPIAFGLKAIKIAFAMDENKGATDPLEEDIKKIEGVNSVEAIDVRRALG